MFLRNIFLSVLPLMVRVPRWLRLQEQIDYCYFIMGQIARSMPKNGMDKIIDEATGYDAARREEIVAMSLGASKPATYGRFKTSTVTVVHKTLFS
jgi:hypothetical protein